MSFTSSFLLYHFLFCVSISFVVLNIFSFDIAGTVKVYLLQAQHFYRHTIEATL